MNKMVFLRLVKGLTFSAALALPMMVRAQGDFPAVPGELNTAVAWTTGSTGNFEVYSQGDILYIPVGPKLSSAEVRSGTQESRDKAHALIMERLREEELKLGREERELGEEAIPVDRIVILLDEQGAPILPNAERVRKQSPSLLVGAVPNELTFTFNSAAYPWSASDLATLQANIDTFYPVIKEVYGSPAFSNTMNIRRDPTLTDFAGYYFPSTNELVLHDANNPDVQVHEMIHAFRDDYLLSPGTFEEGMTRAAEIEVFSRTGVTHPWDDKHSYTYDIHYSGLDMPAIGSQNGNIFMGFIGVLLRYQLSGYAWGKALIENSNFLVNFNQQLYPAMLADMAVGSNLTTLTNMAAVAQANVEGKPFQTWYAQQGIFDAAPPQGYQLYHLTNQGTAYYFLRDASGVETMQASATLQWQEYDYQDTLLLSGSETTNSNGWINCVGCPGGSYQGRVRFETTVQSPDGLLTDSSMHAFGSEAGIFGYLPKSNTGKVTFTSLDNVVLPVTVNVVNGAFAADTLGSVRGRFRADFTNGADSFSVYFNKDASPYFLPMAFTIQGRVTDLAGAALKGATLTLSGASTATTTSGPDGEFFFPHLEGGQGYTVTPTQSGVTFSPAIATMILNDKASGIDFASQSDTIVPTGTISINGGAAATTIAAVTLTLSAADIGSGVATMRFSNDNVTWGSWQTYATSAAYTLTSGNGTKTVYAQFRDASLNVSATVSDTITLQTSTAIRIGEDFSLSTATSRFMTLKGGTWSVANGLYKLSSPSTAYTTHNANISVHTSAISNDFVLTANAKVSGTAGNSDDFSIVFGLQDARNYYFANFSETNGSASNGLFKVVAGVSTQLADFTTFIKSGAIYSINITRSGSTIIVRLGGTVLGVATDSTFLTGKVGFGSRNDSCQFDNLLVP